MESRFTQATLIIEVSPVMFANEILFEFFFVVAASHSAQCIAPYNFDERCRCANRSYKDSIHIIPTALRFRDS
ncbi:MAG: hypothetical protein RIR02_373 [Pseudomonadota bacterium]